MFRCRDSSSGDTPFDRINTGDASGLKLAFDYRIGLAQGHESRPVVNGHYLFITTRMKDLIALDATTGAVLWTNVQDRSRAAPTTVEIDRASPLAMDTQVAQAAAVSWGCKA